MSTTKGQKKNSSISERAEEETTPTNARTAALARLAVLIPALIEWAAVSAIVDPDGKTAKVSRRVLENIVALQCSFAYAATLFYLGESILELIALDAADMWDLNDHCTGPCVDEPIRVSEVRAVQEGARLAGECLALGLALSSPIPGEPRFLNSGGALRGAA